MGKIPMLCGCLLGLWAGTALAADAYLRWNNCFGGGTATNGSRWIHFACDGSPIKAWSSYILDAPQPRHVSTTTILGIRVEGATPDFWRGNAGCGSGMYTVANPAEGLPVGIQCVLPGGTHYAAAQVYRTDFYALGESQAEADVAHSEIAIDGGVEYYAQKHIFDTNGNGSGCAGCDQPVCITLRQIIVEQTLGAPGGNTLINPWGGCPYADLGPGPGAILGNTGSTSTKNTTWGAVKSLYR